MSVKNELDCIHRRASKSGRGEHTESISNLYRYRYSCLQQTVEIRPSPVTSVCYPLFTGKQIRPSPITSVCYPLFTGKQIRPSPITSVCYPLFTGKQNSNDEIEVKLNILKTKSNKPTDLQVIRSLFCMSHGFRKETDA